MAFVPTPPVTYTRFLNESQIISFPGLTYRLSYLEAPISVLGKNTPKSVTDEKLVSPDFYHAGIGIQSTDPSNPVEFTLDYELVTGFTIDSFLPEIDDGELIWNNQTEVLIGNYIDRNYWIRSDYICDINNDILVGLQQWTLNTWIPQNPNYSLFSAVLPSSDDPSEPDRETLFNPIMRSSTCNDYCYELFNYLISVQVCIQYDTPPMNNVNAFIVERSQAKVVSYEDKKTEIVNFYTLFEIELRASDDILDRIEEIIEELPDADPDEIPILLAELIVLSVALIVGLESIYESFETVYYYGYDENGPAYWEFDNPQVFINYVEGNLYRSFSAVTPSGIRVNDGYTRSNQTCNIQNSTASERSSLVYSPQSTTAEISYLLIGLFVLLIFGFILYYLYKREKANISK